MCYRLYLASPLTLSEMRAMLPAGVTAHLLPPDRRDRILALLPTARDAVSLWHGGCACDLAGQRLPDTSEDERRLRARYRKLGTPRAEVIQALEAHRDRPRSERQTAGHWPQALAGFVLEHARNAGPALYLLEFTSSPTEPPVLDPERERRVPAKAVRSHPSTWLEEAVPMLVVP